MPESYKPSFLIITAVIFLLPIFFIPGGALFLDSAKSALLALGILSAAIIFIYELWQKGMVSIPKSYFLVVAALLPAVYLASALLTAPSSPSLFGYSFEIGTFGFIVLGSAALILVSIIFEDTSRMLQALTAFFLSLSVLAAFVVIKILSGGSLLVLGNFFGNMGNPLGSWTDLAIMFGLLSVFSALTLGMLPLKAGVRILIYSVFGLSTLLLVILSFSIAFIFTLAGAAILGAYFIKVEKNYPPAPLIENSEQKPNDNFYSKPTFLPIILFIVSLLFLINPNIPGANNSLGGFVSSLFKVENAEVRPSLTATLGISKEVLKEGALLGSGPNTFSRDWLIYKPIEVNTTPFWAVAFPFGVGFIPTQIASTGILGTILWILFIVALILLGKKALQHLPESRAERFTIVSSFFITFFLWIASVFYVPSSAVLMLAFIFAGAFVATLTRSSIIESRSVGFTESSKTRIASLVALILLVVGSLWVLWVGFSKTVSAYYFKKAIDLSNSAGTPLEEVEAALNKALSTSPADAHFIALSRLNFAKAQVAANSTEGEPEDNRILFEASVRKSIEAARNAVAINPAGYENWVTLGAVYGALVPAPLSVPGAYENAQYSYSEALKRNPTNPELPLLFARLELNKEDYDGARAFIQSSIALKEDYADAYLMLAQLETLAGNTSAAISSVEKLVNIQSNNPGLHFELGLLKYSIGDFEGAVRALNDALNLSPDYANAKYYLGLSLAQLDQFTEAEKHFEDLLVTNPDVREVKDALKAVRSGQVPSQQ